METKSIFGSHDKHWNALFGHDWLIETPSLIYTVVDESEEAGLVDNIQWLRATDGPLSVHSFLRQSKLISVFPCIEPARFDVYEVLGMDIWENSPSANASLRIRTGAGAVLNAFVTDYFERPDQDTPRQIQLGLSALCYSLRQAKVETTPNWHALEENEDGGTSYAFSGAKVLQVERAVHFYHTGWLADLEIQPAMGENLKLRVWIHQKNIPEPPVVGNQYSGQLWLQCCSPSSD